MSHLVMRLKKSPDMAELILFMLNRREAVESSQIEGTSTTFDGLLLHENTTDVEADTNPDAAETLAYVVALQEALQKVRQPRFKGFSHQLIAHIHQRLMQQYPDRLPGKYKNSVNYIGGFHMETARFIPAPPQCVKPLMDDLLTLMNYEQDSPLATPLLMRAAIVHAQFESIHPFLDGNGRTGRMLIPLMLEAEGYPGIHLATFLKLRKQDYYDALLQVQMKLNWSPWLTLFYECVVASCRHTIALIDKLEALQAQWSIQLDQAGVRSDASARKIAALLLGRPILTVKQASALCDVTFAAANNGLEKLHALGIVSQRGQATRKRVFQANAVLSALYDGVNSMMDSAASR
ncbi:MAG TPA: Fic family protein [Limnobacter sp.]|uniref:Fic family protein n=1 Tax=Limnobacter sp. TaxID=2003368 RepID=UPI002EDA5E86